MFFFCEVCMYYIFQAYCPFFFHFDTKERKNDKWSTVTVTCRDYIKAVNELAFVFLFIFFLIDKCATIKNGRGKFIPYYILLLYCSGGKGNWGKELSDYSFGGKSLSVIKHSWCGLDVVCLGKIVEAFIFFGWFSYRQLRDSQLSTYLYEAEFEKLNNILFKIITEIIPYLTTITN